jgi:hypothetical protein
MPPAADLAIIGVAAIADEAAMPVVMTAVTPVITVMPAAASLAPIGVAAEAIGRLVDGAVLLEAG